MAGSCAINVGKLQRIFSYYIYINVLSFSQYLISIFTIDYVHEKNFILQLEHVGSAAETSLLFNVNFSW